MGFPSSLKVLPHPTQNFSQRDQSQRACCDTTRLADCVPVVTYFFLFTTNMSDEPNPKIQLKITFEGQSKGYKSPSLLKLRT